MVRKQWFFLIPLCSEVKFSQVLARGEGEMLLDRDALGQVPRLIHVAAAPHGQVVSQ